MCCKGGSHYKSIATEVGCFLDQVTWKGDVCVNIDSSLMHNSDKNKGKNSGKKPGLGLDLVFSMGYQMHNLFDGAFVYINKSLGLV